MIFVGTVLNLGEKLKIYPQSADVFINLATNISRCIVLLTMAKKWRKVKNAGAGCAKLLFLPSGTKYAQFVMFLLLSPLSLPKLHNFTHQWGMVHW